MGLPQLQQKSSSGSVSSPHVPHLRTVFMEVGVRQPLQNLALPFNHFPQWLHWILSFWASALSVATLWPHLMQKLAPGDKVVPHWEHTFTCGTLVIGVPHFIQNLASQLPILRDFDRSAMIALEIFKWCSPAFLQVLVCNKIKLPHQVVQLEYTMLQCHFMIPVGVPARLNSSIYHHA